MVDAKEKKSELMEGRKNSRNKEGTNRKKKKEVE